MSMDLVADQVLTDSVGPPTRVLAVHDPTDLIAIPAVFVALWLGCKRSAPGTRPAKVGSRSEVV
jgi:hypothetical protein